MSITTSLKIPVRIEPDGPAEMIQSESIARRCSASDAGQ